MMKQNTYSSMLTPREIEVLEILAELPTLILKSESSRGFPFTWGRKRRRSAIRVAPSPSSPPPLKAEASSPATPLSFSPSESEDKHTLFRRNVSLKRKREHYLKITEELTKDNNLLHGEIKNVKRYLEKLKDYNLKLKAREKELRLGPNQNQNQNQNQNGLLHEKPQVQFCGTAQHLPLIMNQTTGPTQISGGEEFRIVEACETATTSLGVRASTSSMSALGMANTNNNAMGPIGIPDLNVPVDESTGMGMGMECSEIVDLNVRMANKDLSRAMAALARQNRLQIYRIKNPIANSKTRYSFR
ncbi:uncharacterized protein LOC133315652 [Gastrolobium bilobum]|uniref:uncharacterized protein LOC133315652 n=1 Tax=Gastrolobium bilobum TaxID=150636 RepID=UPI002AB110B0|nr:uncharacterized protein LOC133315652 [Gastrolobium bilobum]